MLKATTTSHSRLLVTLLGNAVTRCYFFVRSGERWRYVTSAAAPSTVWHPTGDASVGLRDAVARLEAVTALKLTENGKLRGVDSHVVVASVGEPLKIALLADHAKVERALQDVLRLVPASVVSVFKEGSSPAAVSEFDGVALIVVAAGSYPKTQVVLGQWTAGLSRAVARAKLMRRTGPQVLFVGAKESAEFLRAELGQAARVDVIEVDWGNPSGVDLSELGNRVLDLFEALQSQGAVLQCLEPVGASAVFCVPSVTLVAARFLSEYFGRSILYVDVGARDTILVSSAPGRAWATVWPLTGTALGAPGLARLLNGERLASEGWEASTALDYLFNRAIRPWVLPVSAASKSLQDQLLLQTLARLWPSGLRPDTLILSGALRWLQGREHILGAPAVAMKGQGRGLVEIVVDEPVPLAVVGAVSKVDAAAALEVLEAAVGSFMGAYLRVEDAGLLTVDDAEYQVNLWSKLWVPVQSEVALLRYQSATGSLEARVAGGRYGILVDCVGGTGPQGEGR